MLERETEKECVLERERERVRERERGGTKRWRLGAHSMRD